MSGEHSNIAQLRVEKTSEVCRGSGYRVTDDLVLTATHVVADSGRITVTFNADLPTQFEVEAELAAQCADLALVRIKLLSDRNTKQAKFGRVGSRVSTVRFTSSGFPMWQLRVEAGSGEERSGGTRFRDVAQVTGSFPTASSWREGMLELLVDHPPAEMDLSTDPTLAGVTSEWEGMSGAAVWAEDRIVGVISAHARAEGLGHLRATRVEQLFRHDDDSSLAFRRLLRLPEGSSGEALVDVSPTPYAERLALEFEGDFREIAPLDLLDRERELGDLSTFSHADDYVWIQAPAWSGKTALSSWLALNPSKGVTVVAFFIVKRQIGRADVNAFLDALLAQLSVFDPTAGQAPANLEEKRRRFGAVLKRAAELSLADGRRLTLLVDGLDEDVSNEINLPSIASLLPSKRIPGLNVIVTGRPVPLPIDVDGSHPLRACRIYELDPSPHAKTLETAAKQELAAILAGDDELSVDLLGFLTVSGGGLTARELQDLTTGKLSPIKNRLQGPLVRSLAVHSGFSGESIYLFGHATLAETAREYFSDEQDEYAARLHKWAGDHALRGWSDKTPQFLLARYFRLLSALGAQYSPRMIELATSEERHDVMLKRTNGDWDALAEIELTRGALETTEAPHLEAAVRLSIEHRRLVDRSASIPLESGPRWARLGDTSRARLTAQLITRPLQKPSFLAEIAEAIASTGDVVQAQEVADEITDFRTRLRALANVAMKYIERRDFRNAEKIADFLEESARAFPDLIVRAGTLAMAAECYSFLGNTKRAEDLSKEIEDLASRFNNPKSPVKGTVAIVARLASFDQVDRAWRIAAQISEPTWHAEALCAVIPYLPVDDARRDLVLKSVHRTREQHTAVELLARSSVELRPHDSDLSSEYLSNASKMSGYSKTPEALGTLAIATAVSGDLPEAMAILDTMQADSKVSWLCNMTRELVKAGQHSEAMQSAEKAERLVAVLATASDQTRSLIDIADSYLALGNRTLATELLERAEELSRQSVSRTSVRHWASVAVALAKVGRMDCAEVIVNKIHSSVEHTDMLRLEMVGALSDGGYLEKAVAVARLIVDQSARFRAYVRAVTARPQMERQDQGEDLLAEVIDFYKHSSVIDESQPEVAALIECVAMLDRPEKAEELAQSLKTAEARNFAANALARAAARAGDFDNALRHSAVGYLQEHRSKSASVGGTSIVEVAKALDRVDVVGAMESYHRLDDVRLRSMAGKWMLRSSLELTEDQRETLKVYGRAPSHVNGVARALVEADMPNRATDLLKEVLSSENQGARSQRFKCALVESVEAAVVHNRTDMAKGFLSSTRYPSKDGTHLLGYCLAAHGKIEEAWAVLREGADEDLDEFSRSVRDAEFFHASAYKEALVNVAREHVKDKPSSSIAGQIVRLFRGSEPLLVEAVVVLLAEVPRGIPQAADVDFLMSKLVDPTSRVFALSRASEVLVGRGRSSDAGILMSRVRDMLNDGTIESRAAMFMALATGSLSVPEIGRTFSAVCQQLLLGPRWTGALHALLVLDHDALANVAEYLAEVCPSTALT